MTQDIKCGCKYGASVACIGSISSQDLPEAIIVIVAAGKRGDMELLEQEHWSGRDVPKQYFRGLSHPCQSVRAGNAAAVSDSVNI